MFKRGVRFWAIAATIGVLALGTLFGRVLVSAAYVNGAAMVLARTTAESRCALGIPRFDLEPARRARASALLGNALAWNATNQRAWRLMGEIALSQNDLARAGEALGHVNQQGFANESARFWLAYIETEQGQTAQARPAWTTPRAEAFLLALGDCFVAYNDPAQAQRYYTIARDDAKSVVAYTRLGDIAFNAKRLDEAHTSYQYVIDHSDDPTLAAGANLGLGRVLLRRGDLDGADQQFATAFANNTSASMASRIGIALRLEQQYERSNVWLQQWSEQVPDSPDPYRVLGANALDMGQPAQAIVQFSESIQRGGKSAQLFFDLGTAYERTDDKANARQAYERVLAIDPNNENARKRLQALNQ